MVNFVAAAREAVIASALFAAIIVATIAMIELVAGPLMLHLTSSVGPSTPEWLRWVVFVGAMGSFVILVFLPTGIAAAIMFPEDAIPEETERDAS